nr:ribosome biosynthesis protein rrb1 [Polyrhizophydium stewartii]
MGKRKNTPAAAAVASDAEMDVVDTEESPRKDARSGAAQTAGSAAKHDAADVEDMGEFEDAWEDEIDDDDEGEVVIAPDSDDEDEAMEQDDEDDDDAEKDVQVYLPGQKLDEGEVLVADQSTYEMLHAMHVEWPCLSFDVARDNLGAGRTTFPMTAYVVAGSQASEASLNRIYVMKMSSLHKTKHDGDMDDDDDDDDDDLDEDPILEFKTISHAGGINRIRLMPHPEVHVAATMADTGKVHIYDLTQHIQSLDTPGLIPNNALAPMHTVTQHGKTEGYAIDWSHLQTGHLLTGDCRNRIFLTTKTPAAFATDATAFTGHTSSVEDIQWSPSQPNVFASASADRTIRIWDARDKKRPKLTVTAHDSDVNVISWNRLKFSDHVLASGAESGAFSIWDLRTWPSSQGKPAPSASFKWHQGPVTSVDWHPTESSMLAVSGADDQITIWDLALERDQEEEPVIATGASGEKVEVPPQLLFIHQGQHNIKEVHWHRQIPGTLLSTAFDGFNIFKTINS